MTKEPELPSYLTRDENIPDLIVCDESKLVNELHKSLKKIINASVYVTIDPKSVPTFLRCVYIRISKMNVYWEHKVLFENIIIDDINKISEHIAWGMKQQILDTFFYSLPPEYNIKQQREMR